MKNLILQKVLPVKEQSFFELSSVANTGFVLKDETMFSASSGDSILKPVSFS
jgi:hypothetical protein